MANEMIEVVDSCWLELPDCGGCWKISRDSRRKTIDVKRPRSTTQKSRKMTFHVRQRKQSQNGGKVDGDMIYAFLIYRIFLIFYFDALIRKRG